MKKLLFFLSASVILSCGYALKGQTLILSENFSGFSTGNHSSPSTVDASTSIDTKTQVPGWSGSGIYPAAGEIKISTATVNGWIESPAIDLSGYEGKFRVKFDICRWPADATTVQVLLNGIPIGSNITPGDSYETISIDASGGTADSRIKISALSKRFYLDNFSVSINNVATAIRYKTEYLPDINIYPVPAGNILNFENVRDIRRIEITDLSGRAVKVIENISDWSKQVDIGDLESGVYIVRMVSQKGILVKRFMKL
jgi:hypothetical protein